MFIFTEICTYKQAHPVFAKFYDQAAAAIAKGFEKYKQFDAKLDKAWDKSKEKVSQKFSKGKNGTESVSKSIPEPDYSTPHAPYSLRVDPITGKGPMHVDSRDFTRATSYTAEGAPRNKDQFWRMWAEKYPETLSAENLKRINLKVGAKSPKVDEVWIKSFPEHTNYLKDTLVHHHIGHGNPTTALPDKLHRTHPGRSMFHDNLGGVKKND